ncbi:cell division protein FtsA [Alkalibacterium olivapovliticus]|uniref:Cell division protein FtsA n=1 Tax=Alkalibacterium olivapovliticus TaxID=99907 RepID=A0A2T0WBR5_9LACT|nr:cell division protein FtsA [Alkalibacterium olivapovliticus]PRY83954.1 cell division protein FtsA [Alkalibacterium olivapovliticus]
MKDGIYSSLDIGTTSIKVIVSEVLNSKMNVIGVGSEKCNGINKGLIIDIDETAQSVKKAVKQAEEKSGIQIGSLIVGVPATNVEINPFHVTVSVENASQEINNSLLKKIIELIKSKKVPNDKTLLSIMVEEFLVDGFDGIKDPRKMVGEQVELYGTLLAVSKTVLHNIKKSVNNAGFEISDMIFQPHAMSELVMSEDERRFGTIQIDLGGGQTSASAVHDEQVKFATIIQEGGENITKDISVVLNTSLRNAEKLKREVGYAFRDDNQEKDQLISVDVVGQEGNIEVKESYIAEIIEARLSQIFEKVREELEEIGAFDLPGGIIMTGGTAAIPGVEELAEDIFEVNVKTYIPDFMGVRYPSFSNAIGLVHSKAKMDELSKVINHMILNKEYALSETGPQETQPAVSTTQKNSHQQDNKDNESVIEKIKSIFSNFFE